MKSANFTRHPLTAAEDPDWTDKYVSFYTFILFNSVLFVLKKKNSWLNDGNWLATSRFGWQLTGKNKNKTKQNDLFESVSTFSSGGSRRLLLADISWNENFYQLIVSALSKIVIKYQNASVRDNVYNAHVGFREWE